MKKVLLMAIVTLFLSSCITKFPYQKESYVINYSHLSENGFFITESNSVSFNYTPLGSVTSIVTDGYEVLSHEKKTYPQNAYPDIVKDVYKYGKYKIADINDALDILYSETKKLGGNGIINLKITYNTTSKTKDGLSINNYVVTGMAIKK